MTSGVLDPPAMGTSAIQSGRSLAPLIGEKIMPGLIEPNSGFVDEFAAMEDDFDDAGVIQPHIMKVTPSTAEGSTKTLAALLVIAVFALAGNAFHWAQATKAEPSVPKLAEPKAIVTRASAAATGGNTAIENFAALEQAIRAGDEERCRQVLKECGHGVVRQEDACGCTALHIAAHIGSAAATRLLLDHGARVDAREAWDETPLHFAARCGSTEVCELLVARGADVNAVNMEGWTPLLSAAKEQQEAVCELLLIQGAGAGGLSDDELPPMLSALLIRRMFASTCAAPQDQADKM